ncbi:MAG: hypothetical protein P8R54_33790 [Myxococcota bacterium]|nr:hypothetical protein [Myxococcota bacterium]
MLKGVARRRKKKRREDEGRTLPQLPPDTIADPLRSQASDPMAASVMRPDTISDDIAEAGADHKSSQQIRTEREEFSELRDAMVELDIDETPTKLDEDEIEDIVIAVELDIAPEEVDEHEDVLDKLLAVSSLNDDELNLEEVAEDDLEVEEIVELIEIDELGSLMNELATSDALNADSSVVEALIDEELTAAVDANTNGFANAFVTPEDMISNEQQSQRRPMDDADTRMQVTQMSWVPNLIKVPLGRIAMDTRPLDRALNHHIKQDVSTLDEDNDIGVRTRRRFTPGIPDRKTVAANMAETHNQSDLLSTLTVLQTYHEVMQSTPDMAKTYLLGQIRMLDTWTKGEEPRLDLKEGKTPLDWARSVLLPSIIADMSELENYFDMDHDMYFYRQWKSEALRVMREMDQRLEVQAELRREMDDDQELTDILDAIPAGELVEWAMDNPDEAESLFQDVNHREAFTSRLVEELFSDGSIHRFLELIDALVSPEGEEEEDPMLDQIRDALLTMDINRLSAMAVLPELVDYHEVILAGISAVSGLNPRFHGLIQDLVGRYGTQGKALEGAIRDNPTPMVHAVVHGGRTIVPPAALQRGDDEIGVSASSSGLLDDAVDEDEDDDAEEGDDDDGEVPPETNE